ncbi:MAG: hypothetical protein GEU79_00590 [Acidimicrobiia bacterium]|nr:hypothetical protein [Acidimicrobiia bacterium]
MALDIACPMCGETDDLSGSRLDDHIEVTCGSCGQVWERPTTPVCPQCDGRDLRAVPLAIVEKSRGTQLSMVGSASSISAHRVMQTKSSVGIAVDRAP